jgi:hypothetical protein
MASQKPTPKRSWSHFQKLAEAYERAPTLVDYVRIRRTFGVSGIDPGIFTAFDPFIVVKEEFQKFGINAALVSGALDGDGREIDELALQLIERLVEREKIEKGGATHVQGRRIAINDSLVNFLIVAMVEAAGTQDSVLPPSLTVLIRDRLCGAPPDIEKEFSRKQRRRDAVALAALKFPPGKVSIRKVARLMGVEPSTISRWFPDGTFQQHVDEFRTSIDALV